MCKLPCYCVCGYDIRVRRDFRFSLLSACLKNVSFTSYFTIPIDVVCMWCVWRTPDELCTTNASYQSVRMKSVAADIPLTQRAVFAKLFRIVWQWIGSSLSIPIDGTVSPQAGRRGGGEDIGSRTSRAKLISVKNYLASSSLLSY